MQPRPPTQSYHSQKTYSSPSQPIWLSVASVFLCHALHHLYKLSIKPFNSLQPLKLHPSHHKLQSSKKRPLRACHSVSFACHWDSRGSPKSTPSKTCRCKGPPKNTPSKTCQKRGHQKAPLPRRVKEPETCHFRVALNHFLFVFDFGDIP